MKDFPPDVRAEIRWFLPGPLPEAMRDWFRRAPALGAPLDPTEEEVRTDLYLLAPGAEHVGLKLRGGGLELKIRRGEPSRLPLPACGEGMAEVWEKHEWPCDKRLRREVALAFAPLARDARFAEVRKRRSRRGFEIHGGRWKAEVTDLEVAGRSYWTIAAERRIPEIDRLYLCVDWLFRAGCPSSGDLTGAASMGYPAWLLRSRDAAVAGPVNA